MSEKEIATDFLKQIEIGSRALLMYSEKHPSAQQAIENACAQMTAALREREELVVKIEDGQIKILEMIAEKDNPLLERLMRELMARNIYNLTLTRGITREELVLLMQDLNLKPQRI